MKNIGIFCGSSMGNTSIYAEAAQQLAKAMAAKGMRMVYGGANVGLMKVMADTMLEAGAEVVGVMPYMLSQQEIVHPHLDQMIEVDTMAERKEIMIDRSDAFIALPGGFGTIDELGEVLVMNQIKEIDKPVALYNINGYFDAFISFCKRALQEGFIRNAHLQRLMVSSQPEELLSLLQQPQSEHNMAEWIHDLKEESK